MRVITSLVLPWPRSGPPILLIEFRLVGHELGRDDGVGASLSSPSPGSASIPVALLLRALALVVVTMGVSGVDPVRVVLLHPFVPTFLQ